MAIPRTIVLEQKMQSENIAPKLFKRKQYKSGLLTDFCRKWLTAFAFCLGQLGVTATLASSIDFAIIRATSFVISSLGTCCEDQEPTLSHLPWTRLNQRFPPRRESRNNWSRSMDSVSDG